MFDLSIVILTYNQLELTRQTLVSVQQAMESGLITIQTIVADNGSTESLLEMVRSEFPWVVVVENKENLGFSAGNNRGVEKATGRYVLFLNSDTKIVGDVLPVLIERMERDATIGIATCRVELENGSIDPASHRGFPTPWRALSYYSGLEKLIGGDWFGGYHLLKSRDSDVAHEIDACTGAFLLMRRSVGEELGWWDEQFFMYGEDLDLCYRVKERGLKVMFYPDQKIVHYKHSSGLKIKVDKKQLSDTQVETKKRTLLAFYDAMKLFYNKHYTDKYPSWLRAIVFVGVDAMKHRALSKINNRK